MLRRRTILGILVLLSIVFGIAIGTRETPVESRKFDMEIHLQEGFFGQRVRIDIDGVSVKEIDALTTKLMIGLAEVVTLDVTSGQEVSVKVEGEPKSERVFVAQPDRPFVAVSRTDDGLTVDFPDQTPGYL